MSLKYFFYIYNIQYTYNFLYEYKFPRIGISFFCPPRVCVHIHLRIYTNQKQQQQKKNSQRTEWMRNTFLRNVVAPQSYERISKKNTHTFLFSAKNTNTHTHVKAHNFLMNSIYMWREWNIRKKNVWTCLIVSAQHTNTRGRSLVRTHRHTHTHMLHQKVTYLL